MNSDLILALILLTAIEVLHLVAFGWEYALAVFVGIVLIFWVRITFF